MKTLDRVVLYGGLGLVAILAAIGGIHRPAAFNGAEGGSTKSFTVGGPPANDFAQPIYIIMGDDNRTCYTFPPASGPAYPEFSSFASPFVADQIYWQVIGPTVRSYTLQFKPPNPLQGIAGNTLPVAGKTPTFSFYQIGDNANYKNQFTYRILDNNGNDCGGMDMGVHIDR